MSEKIKKLARTKTGRIFTGCALVLLLYGAANSTAVTVINYPYLMQLAQKTITDSIRNKIQEVWQKELSGKLEAGFIKADGLTMPTVTSNMADWTDTFLSGYKGGYFGNSSAWYAQIAKKNAPLVFPTAADDITTFQKHVRDISIAIQGIPSGINSDNLAAFYKNEFAKQLELHGGNQAQAEKAALAELARHKKAALNNDVTVAVAESGFEGTYMADKAKKELARISPRSFDSIKSDQAIKDLVKIMHYNAVLQAQMLKVMSTGEVRSAIHSSHGR